MREELRYASAEAMATATAEAVAETLRAAIDARGRASLVVSGGRTPEALFRALARLDLPWAQVTVTLADERWLHPEDPESNEHLVRTVLLTGPAAAARFIGLKTAAANPAAAVPELRRRLAGLARPFDAVLLGMGEDGHTASLFPDADELPRALAAAPRTPVAALTPPAAPHARVTLTPAALRDARALWLLLSGERKWSVYQQALTELDDVSAMPVRAVLGRNPGRVHVVWAPT